MKGTGKAKKIKEHLINSYPDLSELFENVEAIECLNPSKLSIPSAITRIIIGQMLSAKAAATIHGRVKNLAEQNNIEDWTLNFEEYRSCGLSKTKANAIVTFADYYKNNKIEVENWKNLSSKELIDEIIKHKGIGRWTATIMALFHFGKEDVFPELDGSLKKAMELIEQQFNVKINPDLSSPFRSYLAYYFWHFLDKGLLK